MNNLIVNKRINNIKTFMLMSIMFAVIVFLGLILAGVTHNISYLWGSLFISLVLNISSYFFSDTIALSTSGAVAANPDEHPEYYNIVKSLTSKADMPMPRLYIINDPAPNAFATGRNENNAAVAVTTGLLSMMNREELAGVIAHELSHIRNKDILIMSTVVVMTGIFTMISHFIINISLSKNSKNSDNSQNIIFAIIGLLASILLPIASMIVQATISRKREYIADASGAILADNRHGLASALQKIGAVNVPMHNANQATAHLYISNPFGGGSDDISLWSRLFMTHPPIEDRIKALTE